MLDARPDLDSLAAALSLAVGDPVGRPRLLRRRPNPYGHSRSEIIRWRLPDGQEIEVFCKSDDDSDPHSDVAYEARVYREVLEPLGLSTLHYYGSGADETGRSWMLLEYASGPNDRDRTLSDKDAMVLSARWLGDFHAACERQFETPPPFLRRFDAAYYGGLARRAAVAADAAERPWLETLSERLPPFLCPLMEERATIVHTDFYDDNVLIQDGRVRPIDWEMAAVDLGESDLVFLSYGWDNELEAACAAAYVDARWPEGAPDDFELLRKTARMCLHLYKLANQDWRGSDGRRRHTAYVRALAAEVDVLEGGAA